MMDSLKNIKMHNKAFLIIIFILIAITSCNIASRSMYKLDLDESEQKIKIREIKHENQKSVIQISVFKRGTYVASIMTTLCSYADIARKRGYQYFVVLNEENIKSCSECEWASKTVVGFLNSKDDNLLNSFKKEFGGDKDYIIHNVNEFALTCGFIPIPDDEFNLAVYNSNLRTVKKLLSESPNYLNEKNSDELTPLHIAVAESQLRIVKYLISQGADVNKKGVWGYTPLHLASSSKLNKEDVVKILIGAHADPNAKMINGYTPLHLAAIRGNIAVAKLLIKAGSIVNDIDEKGNTPLHLAALNCKKEMIEFLIQNGAMTAMKNNKGQTYAEILKLKNCQ